MNTEDEIADVSLWEHLSLTATIANCFYLYSEEKNLLDLEEIKKSENKEVFRLVVGDFSGIQKYIFDIQKMKSAAKRLKGRSFLVQLILDDIKNRILSELKLNSSNVVISAGGKFIILVPNMNNTKKDFEKIKKEVEERIFKRFKGEIRFNLAFSEEFGGGEFGEENGDFGKYYDNAFRALAKNQFRPFI